PTKQKRKAPSKFFILRRSAPKASSSSVKQGFSKVKQWVACPSQNPLTVTLRLWCFSKKRWMRYPNGVWTCCQLPAYLNQLFLEEKRVKYGITKTPIPVGARN